MKKHISLASFLILMVFVSDVSAGRWIIQKNTDYYGADIAKVGGVYSAKKCRDICHVRNDCWAYTWKKSGNIYWPFGTCLLKGHVTKGMWQKDPWSDSGRYV